MECGSKDVIKKGKNKAKFAVKQIYKCKACGKKFSLDKLKNKTYPANIIMDSVSNYNLGYNLEESRKLSAKKFKVRVPVKTIYNWIKEFNNICSYHRIRNKAMKLFKPNEVLLNKIFFHQQPYKFCLHKAKTEIFANEYFKGLKSYLFNITRNCPNELFNRENVRSSEFELNIDFDKIKVFSKENYACKLAKLALCIAKNNTERHTAIEKFMLCNDTCTIAVEVPVYLFLDEVKQYEVFDLFKNTINENTLKNNALTSENKNVITGHIDFVQLKFGSIYVLDYKPEADKINAISQLFVYALALSIRTGVWLRNFRCAWFDEDGYYEFAPSDIVLNFCKVPAYRVKEFYVDNKSRRYFTSKEFQNANQKLKQKAPNFRTAGQGFKNKKH